jgi:cytochrome c biogenesis protein CcmG, thiol:disulfide interchange protein DsbE
MSQTLHPPPLPTGESEHTERDQRIAQLTEESENLKRSLPAHSPSGPLLSLAAGLALIAASLFGFWWLGRSVPSELAAVDATDGLGKSAPDFMLQDVSGKYVRLRDLRGQVVLINLWATWCPPCIAEMPDLAAVYNAHKSEGLIILGVDDQERQETVMDFLSHNPLPYPILLDTDSRVARAYRTDFLPASFLIDRRGVLRATMPGQNDRTKLEAAIKPLLTEKASIP